LARGIRALIAIHRDDREAVRAQMHGVEDLPMQDRDLRLTAELLVWAWALAAGDPARALARLLASFDPEGRRQFPGCTRTAGNGWWMSCASL
jgi:hypothetical protein